MENCSKIWKKVKLGKMAKMAKFQGRTGLVVMKSAWGPGKIANKSD